MSDHRPNHPVMPGRVAALTGLLILLWGTGCSRTHAPAGGFVVDLRAGQETLVRHFTFAAGIGNWTATTNTLRLAAVPSRRDARDSCLAVRGTVPADTWGAVASPRFYLLPGRTYRVSGWLQVNRRDAPDTRPYLRLQLDRVAAGHPPVFLQNVCSPTDASLTPGRWQRLTFRFTTPRQTGLMGTFFLEKGDDRTAATLDLDLADVRLVLLP